MEQSPQNAIGPLFRFPPLALFTFVFVLWQYLFWDLEINDSEEELAPGYEALFALLVFREMDHDAGLVRFEDEVEHRRDLLVSVGGGRSLKHLRGNRDKGREEVLDDLREVIGLLTEPTRNGN